MHIYLVLIPKEDYMYINNQLATQIVETVKDICDHDINFIDCQGIIYASTDIKRIGSFHEAGLLAIKEKRIIEVYDDTSVNGSLQGVNVPVYYHDQIIAVIGISGKPDKVKKYAYLAQKITNLLIREKELNEFNRSQAEKMHYLLQSLLDQENLDSQYFSDMLKYFQLDLKNNYRLLIILAKRLVNEQSIIQELHSLAIPVYHYQYPNRFLAIIDADYFNRCEYKLKKLAGNQVSIAVGKQIPLIKLSESYHSALIALRNIQDYQYINYDVLTLEIILQSISIYDKKDYLNKTIAMLSLEDLNLLHIYFEEDMSLLNTANRLFIHKNTLQYKLDRIHKLCGYNPRKFRDANILYLALKLK